MTTYEIQPAPVAPTQTELDDFKNQVAVWLDLENTIAKMQVAVRERVTAKNAISTSILSFMGRFNIEDLNTKEGVLRYKVSSVKAPISQTIIKEKITKNLQSGIVNPEEFNHKVFEEDRGKREKHSLKRVKKKTLDI